MTTDTPTLADLDITDPALYCGPRDYPWREWDLLRRQAPVYWYEREGYDPFWAITRHADILTVSKHHEIFIQTRTLRIFPREAHRALIRSRIEDEEELGVVEAAPSSFLDMDEPHHSKFRSLINRHFTPRANDGRMDLLEQVGRDCIARFEAELDSEKHGAGVADLVDTVGMYMPMAVILTMLGIPREMQLPLYREVDEGMRRNDMEEMVDRRRNRLHTGSFQILAQALEQRRNSGASDGTLMDVILASDVDGQPISPKQQMGMMNLLVGAGLETTRNAISGGVHALLSHPDQLRLLCENPTTEMINSATEEILRWVSPVIHFARTCVEDFELNGQVIRAGEDVAMWYASANRDEEVFEEPYRFDITRDPNNHLAFGGYGAHFCMGANLARWEVRAALKQLIPFLPRMELVEEPQRFVAIGVHVAGFEELLVRVRN